MSRQQATVEQVRQIQEYFKGGNEYHNEKKYKEAIEAFKNGAAINPFDENHLDELSTKLKTMSVKLVQESIAYTDSETALSAKTFGCGRIRRAWIFIRGLNGMNAGYCSKPASP